MDETKKIEPTVMNDQCPGQEKRRRKKEEGSIKHRSKSESKYRDLMAEHTTNWSISPSPSSSADEGENENERRQNDNNEIGEHDDTDSKTYLQLELIKERSVSEALRQEIANLKSSVGDLRNNLSDITLADADMENNMRCLQRAITDLQDARKGNHRRRRRQSMTTMVAFFITIAVVTTWIAFYSTISLENADDDSHGDPDGDGYVDGDDDDAIASKYKNTRSVGALLFPWVSYWVSHRLTDWNQTS